MSNVVCLWQYANREIGDRIASGSASGGITELLEKLEDWMAKIAVLRKTIVQSLDASHACLDNLDNAIAAIPDPQQRSILQSEKSQARKVLLDNSRTVFEALEHMTSSVRAIRDQCYAITVRQAHDHDATGADLMI